MDDNSDPFYASAAVMPRLGSLVTNKAAVISPATAPTPGLHLWGKSDSESLT